MDGIFTPELCDERHKHVDCTLLDHARQLDVLNKSNATNTANITNLSASLNTLKTAAWGLCASGLIALIGFVLTMVGKAVS